MPEESGFKYNPWLIIILALAFPPFASFSEWDVHPLWYVLGSAACGYVIFDKFIEKSKVRRVKPQQVGPLTPMITPDTQIWTKRFDKEHGEEIPVKTYIPKARFKG